MEGARTRGHDPALDAIAAMVRGNPPQALILSGPDGVGKTTLALDLASGLLCMATDPATRPCRACRACRQVEHGNHPGLFWVRPEGPGGQILIGGEDSPRGIRDLQHDLQLRPLEGDRRVAIIEAAHRMNEPAQGAILKTLEEPPVGVTIVLCVDDDSRLSATIRSRCARLRLGPVGIREIEAILADRGIADAPTAARLARLADGRPGLAMAYALAPDALRQRGELARTFVDLLDAGAATRLATVRTAFPLALELARGLETGATVARDPDGGAPAVEAARTRRSPARTRAGREEAPEPSAAEGSEEIDADPDAPTRATPPAHRRRAAETLIGVAIDVARDLALASAGGTHSLRAPDMLEELTQAAAAIPAGSAVEALERAERAAELIAANVNPELVLDDLVLAWPRRRRAA